jgi:hypothetical protein
MWHTELVPHPNCLKFQMYIAVVDSLKLTLTAKQVEPTGSYLFCQGKMF